MGGRGGGSGRGSSALDTKDVGELRQYMQDHYSVTVHSSADRVDFGVLRSAAGELEGLLKEFPQAAIGIHELNGSESRSNLEPLPQALARCVLARQRDHGYSDHLLERRKQLRVVL